MSNGRLNGSSSYQQSSAHIRIISALGPLARWESGEEKNGSWLGTSPNPMVQFHPTVKPSNLSFPYFSIFVPFSKAISNGSPFDPHLAPRVGLWAPPWHALKAMAGWERCLDVGGMGSNISMTLEGLNFGIELTNDKPLDSRVPMVTHGYPIFKPTLNSRAVQQPPVHPHRSKSSSLMSLIAQKFTTHGAPFIKTPFLRYENQRRYPLVI